MGGVKGKGGLADRPLGLLGVGSALLYAGTAVSMNFVNKATLHVYPLAWTVLTLQMISTVMTVGPLWAFGAVNFPPLSIEKAKQLAPITFLYALNTAFALLGLKTLNIPMYSTLKRMTPMIVLVLKVIMTKTWPAPGLAASVLCVVLGCIIAGAGDLTFDAEGYFYALSSSCLQAWYLLLVEMSGSKNVGSAEMLFYNGILSLPMLLPMVFLTGEYKLTVHLFLDQAAESSGFVPLILLCALLGTLLNLSLFLCTINNSALTTTIVGVLKGVMATFLGFFLLGGVPFNFVNVVGVSLNTVGGMSYTIIKFRGKQARRSTDPAAQFPLSAASGWDRLKDEISVTVDAPHRYPTSPPVMNAASLSPTSSRIKSASEDVSLTTMRERTASHNFYG